jgi:hypothetical protein
MGSSPDHLQAADAEVFYMAFTLLKLLFVPAEYRRVDFVIVDVSFIRHTADCCLLLLF